MGFEPGSQICLEQMGPEMDLEPDGLKNRFGVQLENKFGARAGSNFVLEPRIAPNVVRNMA